MPVAGLNDILESDEHCTDILRKLYREPVERLKTMTVGNLRPDINDSMVIEIGQI